VSIIDTPDGDTNTLGVSHASLGDTGVVSALLGDLGGVRWQSHTNIQLGDGNIEAGSGEGGKWGGEGWDGTVANNQVSLSTNTMDGDTTADETVDQSNEVGELGARVVQVVIVKVQLCAGVGSSGGLEGNINELLAEKPVEDGVTECTVVLEDFVENVPVHDLALILGHDGGDVVLNDLGQGSSIGNVGDPTWQLRVPDQSVTSDLLVVGGCVVDQVVGTGQGEGALTPFSRIPLHGVLWSQDTELSFNDSVDLADTEGILVNSGTKVRLPLALIFLSKPPVVPGLLVAVALGAVLVVLVLPGRMVEEAGGAEPGRHCE